MVFLKQYRDAADPTRACYQAVVEATAARRGPPRETALLSGDLLVKVRREGGLAESLGLSGGAGGAEMAEVRALATFYMDFDFTLGPGQVLWSAEALAPRRREPQQQSRREAREVDDAPPSSMHA